MSGPGLLASLPDRARLSHSKAKAHTMAKIVPHEDFTRARLQKMADGTRKAANYWNNELQKKILTGQKAAPKTKKKKGKK